LKAAVVILNWNGKKFLEQFLPAVVANCPEWARVVVADNASSDDSVSWVKEYYPEVHLIINDQNFGFAGGYNEALKQLDDEYYILLNSDVEVTPNWLEPLIDQLTNSPKLAALQPKILAWHNKTQFEYAGAAGGFIDKNYFAFCRGRIFETFENDHGQYNDFIEVAWATGACLVVRRSAYWEVGGLDDTFFAHMEEIDLCCRLKNSGYSVGYLGTSTVYHVGGGTLNKQSPFKTYLNYRNNLALIVKNHFGSNLFLKLFYRMLHDGVSGVVHLLKGERKQVWAIIKAHFHFYGRLPRLMKQRSELRTRLCEPNRKGFYSGSIVWDYFVERRKSFPDLNNGFEN